MIVRTHRNVQGFLGVPVVVANQDIGAAIRIRIPAFKGGRNALSRNVRGLHRHLRRDLRERSAGEHHHSYSTCKDRPVHLHLYNLPYDVDSIATGVMIRSKSQGAAAHGPAAPVDYGSNWRRPSSG